MFDPFGLSLSQMMTLLRLEDFIIAPINVSAQLTTVIATTMSKLNPLMILFTFLN